MPSRRCFRATRRQEFRSQKSGAKASMKSQNRSDALFNAKLLLISQLCSVPNPSSKDMQLDGQVFLGVLAEIRQELLEGF